MPISIIGHELFFFFFNLVNQMVSANTGEIDRIRNDDRDVQKASQDNFDSRGLNTEHGSRRHRRRRAAAVNLATNYVVLFNGKSMPHNHYHFSHSCN